MTIRWPSDDYPMTIRWLSDDHPMTIWWLSNEYLMTIRWLSDDYPMTIQWLSDDYPMTIQWLSNDYSVKIPWISNDYHELLIYFLDDHWSKRSLDQRWFFMSGNTFILRWSCLYSFSKYFNLKAHRVYSISFFSRRAPWFLPHIQWSRNPKKICEIKKDRKHGNRFRHL